MAGYYSKVKMEPQGGHNLCDKCHKEASRSAYKCKVCDRFACVQCMVDKRAKVILESLNSENFAVVDVPRNVFEEHVEKPVILGLELDHSLVQAKFGKHSEQFIEFMCMPIP